MREPTTSHEASWRLGALEVLVRSYGSGRGTRLSWRTGPPLCPQGCSTGRGVLSCSYEPRGLSCLLISQVPEVGDEATPPLSL
ncbi:unnamed protein product, partial [Gulo gulo]